MFRFPGLRRRSFLLSSLFWPVLKLRAQKPSLVDAGFHLHPRYRSQTTLDAAMLKVNAGADEFVSEQYHDRIAPILQNWTASLLQSPRSTQAIKNVLAPDFLGVSLQPVESRVVQPGPALEIRHITFSAKATLSRSAFAADLQSALSIFSKLLTADFQTTRSADQVTHVRYELVGEGPGFHREQRVGNWELAWDDHDQVRRWSSVGETRSRSAHPWFADVTGQAFGPSAQLRHGVDYWRTVLDGASGIDIYGHNGVSVGDIDGDGFDDLYLCQPAGLPNRLYRNRRDGTFEDITESSGVGLLDNTACALFVDIDNDGKQDLIVVRATGPLLFLNLGGGQFRLKPDAFHFASSPQGTFTGAAAADYDRDGFLDIYFCLYTYYQGADQYKYPIPYYAAENGPPNFLMRNNHDGTFRDVTAEAGLNRNNTRYSFCCGWGDFNRDGWPDLYVVNDFGRKNLYRNNGDGTFTDVAPSAGVEDPGAGMSVCWFDYDNDGADDLYVANMWTAAGERISDQSSFQQNAPPDQRALYRKHAMGNSLFRNRGNGTFADTTTFEGGGMGRWSWSSDAWDFDHDGWPDLYIADGMLSGPMSEDLNSFFWRQVVAKSPGDATPSPEYESGWGAINELIRAGYSWSGFERNVCYRNNRDGTFCDVSGAVGLDFREDGRSFALADFDRDGRLEMLLKNRNAPQVRLLKNVAEALPASIAFRLRGVPSNRDAIGAAITVGNQTRRLQAGSGFLSQHTKEVFFGLGPDSPRTVSASILWPSGAVQEIHDLPVNHRIWVEEGAAPARFDAFHASAPAMTGHQPPEDLPSTVETWLLVPVPAPDFVLPEASGPAHKLSDLRGKPVLLGFEKSLREPAAARAYQTVNLTFDDGRSDDIAAVYSILYRYLFDRHRDITLPTSFLIDGGGDIVKIYQGPVTPGQVERDVARMPATNQDRLALALPFRGVSEYYNFGRNHLSLGSVFFQRGYLEEALQFFQLALQDDPSSAEARYGIGSVYLKQGNNEQAQNSFQQAVKLKATYPDTLPNAWNNLGLISARQGQTDQAISFFNQALQGNSGYWIALENLGNAYRQLKRWDDARGALEQAIALRPQDPEINYSLAMVFAQTGNTQRAYDLLQNALRLRPGYPEALNNLGILYLRTGKRDQAVAAFEECIRSAPAFDQSYLNLARLLSLENKPDQARAIVRNLLQQHPGHVQATQMLDQLH